MKCTIPRVKKHTAILAIGSIMAGACFAGTQLKWEDVPEAVRTTILANGGVACQSVDRESPSHNVDGKTLYEAPIKDEDGNVCDLNITEDGKLIQIKTDDAADRVAELAAGKKILDGVTFSNPRNITNPYLPLSSLKQDILEGTEDGQKIRVERTLMPKKRRTFPIGGREVESLVVEDREFADGKLEEVTLDYFAQDDSGNVYYLGEEVDEYTDGMVTGHDGAWMFGRDTAIPGIIMPANPQIGDEFKSENVSGEINEQDEVLSLSETVTVPAGTYQKCLKIQENPADGFVEHKYYALGVGVVRENPEDGDELLISHNDIAMNHE